MRLDRTLSFNQHVDDVRAKVTSRVSLSNARTLRISQALVFSAAEYCAPVWCRSPHVKKVDTVINNSLRTITGCLKPTPVPYLPVLAGIAPAGLRRQANTINLARKAKIHDWHILHNTNVEISLQTDSSPATLYNKAAQEMLNSIPEDLSTSA